MKAQGFVGCAPQRQQLCLFLCYCTKNKWLYGTRHLRLCHGKLGVEPGGKPGMTLWEWGVQGVKQGSRWTTGTAPHKGVFVSALEASGIESLTARVLWMVRQRRFLNNILKIYAAFTFSTVYLVYYLILALISRFWKPTHFVIAMQQKIIIILNSFIKYKHLSIAWIKERIVLTIIISVCVGKIK